MKKDFCFRVIEICWIFFLFINVFYEPSRAIGGGTTPLKLDDRNLLGSYLQSVTDEHERIKKSLLEKESKWLFLKEGKTERPEILEELNLDIQDLKGFLSVLSKQKHYAEELVRLKIVTREDLQYHLDTLNIQLKVSRSELKEESDKCPRCDWLVNSHSTRSSLSIEGRIINARSQRIKEKRAITESLNEKTELVKDILNFDQTSITRTELGPPILPPVLPKN